MEGYEEPGLSFSEVVDGLKKGHSYRRKSWPNTDYYILSHGLGNDILDLSGSYAKFSVVDIQATDWVRV